MTEDMYQGIAERYDLIGRFGEHDPLALSFFRQLFESKPTRCARIGTRMSSAVQGASRKVSAADLGQGSPTMLRYKADRFLSPSVVIRASAT